MEAYEEHIATFLYYPLNLTLHEHTTESNSLGVSTWVGILEKGKRGGKGQAEKLGVQVGDAILKVNGVSVSGLSFNETVGAIIAACTPVTITFARPISSLQQVEKPQAHEFETNQITLIPDPPFFSTSSEKEQDKVDRETENVEEEIHDHANTRILMLPEADDKTQSDSSEDQENRNIVLASLDLDSNQHSIDNASQQDKAQPVEEPLSQTQNVKRDPSENGNAAPLVATFVDEIPAAGLTVAMEVEESRTAVGETKVEEADTEADSGDDAAKQDISERRLKSPSLDAEKQSGTETKSIDEAAEQVRVTPIESSLELNITEMEKRSAVSAGARKDMKDPEDVQVKKEELAAIENVTVLPGRSMDVEDEEKGIIKVSREEQVAPKAAESSTEEARSIQEESAHIVRDVESIVVKKSRRSEMGLEEKGEALGDASDSEEFVVEESAEPIIEDSEESYPAIVERDGPVVSKLIRSPKKQGNGGQASLAKPAPPEIQSAALNSRSTGPSRRRGASSTVRSTRSKSPTMTANSTLSNGTTSRRGPKRVSKDISLEMTRIGLDFAKEFLGNDGIRPPVEKRRKAQSSQLLNAEILAIKVALRDLGIVTKVTEHIAQHIIQLEEHRNRIYSVISTVEKSSEQAKNAIRLERQAHDDHDTTIQRRIDGTDNDMHRLRSNPGVFARTADLESRLSKLEAAKTTALNDLRCLRECISRRNTVWAQLYDRVEERNAQVRKELEVIENFLCTLYMELADVDLLGRQITTSLNSISVMTDSVYASPHPQISAPAHYQNDAPVARSQLTSSLCLQQPQMPVQSRQTSRSYNFQPTASSWEDPCSKITNEHTFQLPPA